MASVLLFRFHTARKIRELERSYTGQAVGERAEQCLPIIALSATCSDEYRIKSKESGMDDYLSKPLRKEVLKKCLLKWLNKRRNCLNMLR